jgi:hypothetical protein
MIELFETQTFFRNDLQGFECPGMVIVSATVTGVNINELISRCMSNLIIVSVDEDFEQLVENQCDVQIIPAQGIAFFSIFIPLFIQLLFFLRMKLTLFSPIHN